MLLALKLETSRKLVRLIGKNQDETRSDWLMHMLSFFGKFDRQNTHFQFWLKEDHILALTNEAHISRKIAFVHNRPVVLGIVTDPEHYLFSGAHPRSAMKVLEHPWKEYSRLERVGMF